MFNLERGAKTIASIEAASWFPVNTALNFQVRESVPDDVNVLNINKHSMSNSKFL